jgi:hypothetical protein
MGYYLKNRQLQSGGSGVVLPAGSTAQRPDNPVFGLIRYNTDLPGVEYFNGTQFISLADGGNFAYVVDNLGPGDGVTSTFVMSEQVTDPTQIIVFVGSIYQIATTNYTVTGYNISFTSAPPDGVTINVIHSAV